MPRCKRWSGAPTAAWCVGPLLLLRLLLRAGLVAHRVLPPCPQVEILLPEFWDPLSGPVYAEEGDQQRFWKLTRRFIECLAAARPGVRIRAVRGARGGGGAERPRPAPPCCCCCCC